MVSNKLNALISLSAIALLLCSSCSNNHEARMQKLRDDHTSRYQQELSILEDSLRWADSVLVDITPQVNALITEGKFEFVKSDYDELGRFQVKGTDSQSNLGRCYLHATVNEYGICQLISEYRGSTALNHTRIILEGYDGTQVQSALVPLKNEGANYRFVNNGVYHETVTFVADAALSYIDLHVDDVKLRCFQLNANGKKHTVSLTSAERTHISNTFRLGELLATQLRASQLSKVCSEKITLYRSRLDATTN